MFEKTLKEYIGCKYLHSVTSATTGLEVALRALGIGPGDEVIVPDYTYPATASVIAIVGAKAVIVDVSKEDMLLNFEALEGAINKKTKARNYTLETINKNIYIFGIAMDEEEKKEVINEANKIYDVKDVIPSIYLATELSRNKL